MQKARPVLFPFFLETCSESLPLPGAHKFCSRMTMQLFQTRRRTVWLNPFRGKVVCLDTVRNTSSTLKVRKKNKRSGKWTKTAGRNPKRQLEVAIPKKGTPKELKKSKTHRGKIQFYDHENFFQQWIECDFLRILPHRLHRVEISGQRWQDRKKVVADAPKKLRLRNVL